MYVLEQTRRLINNLFFMDLMLKDDRDYSQFIADAVAAANSFLEL